MKKIILINIICFLFLTDGFAQSEIKLDKQQTTFFYTQLNLQAGYVHYLADEGIDIANLNPSNQLAFQLFLKDEETLQRGYVKSISPVSYKFRFSIPFNTSLSKDGNRKANLSFRLLDTWVKLDTKWDRTSIWIGNKSIPYGHNPELDPVSSFMTNLTKLDLGFNQDLGVFLKTPLTSGLDLELSLTSGGFLNKPIWTYDNLIDYGKNLDPVLKISNFTYDNTWLVTSRIGQPSYKKDEFGLIAIAGYIHNVFNSKDYNLINRLGLDWVHKHFEDFKFGNQLTIGFSDSDIEGTFSSLNLQSNADFFLENRIILSTSFALNYLNSIAKDLYHLNFISNSSITYVLSPHTRFRLNMFYTDVVETKQNQWGVLFQFVTGLGDRD